MRSSSSLWWLGAVVACQTQEPPALAAPRGDAASVEGASSIAPAEVAAPGEPDEPARVLQTHQEPAPAQAEPLAGADPDSPPERREGGARSFSPPAHEPGALPRWLRHRPAKGETIEHIAYRYGVDPDAVREWNDMAPDEQPRRIRPPRVRVYAQLNPPPPVRLEHAVAEGDTWASLGRAYGVDTRDLRGWNSREIGRSLEPGEVAEVWVEPTVYASILGPPPRDPLLAAVPAGAHGQGSPQEGRLVAGVPIPEGEGYSIRYPKSAYGTTTAVRAVVEAMALFRERAGYVPTIKLGTMSRPRGGQVGQHESHQTGRDLDIRLPLRAEVPHGLAVTQRRVDWRATWELVRAFADTDDVQVIFLDYQSQKRMRAAARAVGASEEELDRLVQAPRGPSANLGLVRHEPGHDDHIHVRFRCGDEEPSCR